MGFVGSNAAVAPPFDPLFICLTPFYFPKRPAATLSAGTPEIPCPPRRPSRGFDTQSFETRSVIPRMAGSLAKRSNCHVAGGNQQRLRSTSHIFRRGLPMKQSTKDQVKGKAQEIKGKVKETVGRMRNRPDLVAEGTDEKNAGKVQKKIGQVEKVFNQ
jgi:uncharacterized protein YjbJ (UPF0337 family)